MLRGVIGELMKERAGPEMLKDARRDTILAPRVRLIRRRPAQLSVIH